MRPAGRSSFACLLGERRRWANDGRFGWQAFSARTHGKTLGDTFDPAFISEHWTSTSDSRCPHTHRNNQSASQQTKNNHHITIDRRIFFFFAQQFSLYFTSCEVGGKCEFFFEITNEAKKLLMLSVCFYITNPFVHSLLFCLFSLKVIR